MFDQGDQNQQAQDATSSAPLTDAGQGVTTSPAISPTSAEPQSAPLPSSDSSTGQFNTTSFSVDEPASTATPTPAPDVSAALPAIETTHSEAPMSEVTPAIEPATPIVETTTPSTPTPAPEPTSGTSGDLLSIKQNALQSLTPLLDKLEQSPEEKFRTTMMLIQASDDQSLVQVAYDAANSIADEKAKAQALLDVVNEINYFTQSKSQTPAS